MFNKLNLTHKGIILVSVPLLFELLFVVILAAQLSEANSTIERQIRAEAIVSQANVLSRVFIDADLALSSYSITNSVISAEKYERCVAQLNRALEDLRRLTAQDPEEKAVMASLEGDAHKGLEILNQAKLLIAANSTNASGQSEVLKHRVFELIRSAADSLDSDLVKLTDRESKIKGFTAQAQIDLRARLKNILFAAVALSVILGLALAFFFARSIAGRLQLVSDNALRLAGRRELRSPLGGSDEISQLDGVFHRMAVLLAEAAEKERAMIEHAIDVICSVDEGGTFIEVSPAALSAWGYSSDELLGQRYINLVAPQYKEQTLAALDNAIKFKSNLSYENRLMRKDATIIDVDWSVCWAEDKRSLFCVAHDVTMRKRVEKLKQEFVQMISHDLRTPLTSLRMTLLLLLDGTYGTLTENAKPRVVSAESSISRLVSLLNQLLEMEKMEDGKLELRKRETNLTELLNDSIDAVRSLAEKRKIQFDVDCADQIFLADGERLMQVMVNLLGNAVKFSPKGAKIEVSGQADNGSLEVRVKDFGSGIPPDYKDRIFDRFEQVDINDARVKGGSGLGLAICKAIVQEHEGVIGVDSLEGTGSTFWFRIPLLVVVLLMAPLMLCAEGMAQTSNPLSVHFERGVALYKEGKESQSQAELKMVAGMKPANGKEYCQRGCARAALGERKAALADINAGLEMEPTAESYLARARYYKTTGDRIRSLQDLNQALKLQPDNGEVLVERGALYNELGQSKKAVADCNRAIMLNPQQPDSYNIRGNAYTLLNDRTHAIADYTKAIKLRPDFASAYSNRGAVHNDQHQYKEAIADFNKATQLNPKQIEAYNNRGLSYSALGDAQKAQRDFDAAIRLNPLYANGYCNRGYLNNNLGTFNEAIVDLTRALQLNSGLIAAYNNRGYAYAQVGRYAEAIQDLTKAMIQPRLAALALNNLGFCYYKMGDNEKALENLTKSIECDPTLALAYNNRGAAHNSLGEYDKAIAQLNKALALAPSLASALNNRGLSYTELKQYQAAVRDFNKAITLDPKYDIAVSNLGRAYFGMGETDKAIAQYDLALKLNPRLTATLVNRCAANLRLGRSEKALPDANEAIRLDAKYAAAYGFRGQIYSKLGHHELAMKDFDRAISLNPKASAKDYQQRSESALKLGDFEQAIVDFDQAKHLTRPAVIDPSAQKFDSQQYNALVAGYDKIITLKPRDADLYYNRGIIRLAMARHEEAIADFQKFLSMGNGTSRGAFCAAAMGNICCRRIHKLAEAETMLAKVFEPQDSSWPGSVVRYLKGKMGSGELLSLCTDQVNSTAIKTYLGLDLELRGELPAAKKQLTWVQDHGDNRMDEYFLALSELKRLQ